MAMTRSGSPQDDFDYNTAQNILKTLEQQPWSGDELLDIGKARHKFTYGREFGIADHIGHRIDQYISPPPQDYLDVVDTAIKTDDDIPYDKVRDVFDIIDKHATATGDTPQEVAELAENSRKKFLNEYRDQISYNGGNVFSPSY